jgi:PIN domain nuclease of toxin-antitoxin system
MGPAAKVAMQAADRGENTVYVSIFSLVEILYLSEKRRIPITFRQAIDTLVSLDNYRIVDLTVEIIAVAESVRGLELHDRLIVATARSLGIPLLTSDETITNSKLVDIVW